MAEPAQIEELKRKMNRQRAQLLEIVKHLDDPVADRPTTGEGEWSAKQQMAHLCEMESAYRAWIERGLEEDGANVDAVIGERPAIPLPEAQAHTVVDHVAEMRRQRRLTMAMIARMAPSDFDRRAENKLFGSLTVMQWLRSYYRHDRMHCEQLQGAQSTYVPRYAGGKEPDQRRT